MAVSPVPEGYRTVTPYLICRGADAAIQFYTRAFGAIEFLRLLMPDGSIAHAEIRIGDSIVMLSEENLDWGSTSPQTIGGTAVTLHIYVPDVDTVFQRALETGAVIVRPVQDQFYGDRSGCLEDPFGHRWLLSTHIEDVPPDEMERRMQAFSAGEGG